MVLSPQSAALCCGRPGKRIHKPKLHVPAGFSPKWEATGQKRVCAAAKTREELLDQRAWQTVHAHTHTHACSEEPHSQQGSTRGFLLPGRNKPPGVWGGRRPHWVHHSFPFLSPESRPEQREVPGPAQGGRPRCIAWPDALDSAAPSPGTGARRPRARPRFPCSLQTWDHLARGSTCCVAGHSAMLPSAPKVDSGLEARNKSKTRVKVLVLSLLYVFLCPGKAAARRLPTSVLRGPGKKQFGNQSPEAQARRHPAGTTLGHVHLGAGSGGAPGSAPAAPRGRATPGQRPGSLAPSDGQEDRSRCADKA